MQKTQETDLWWGWGKNEREVRREKIQPGLGFCNSHLKRLVTLSGSLRHNVLRRVETTPWWKSKCQRCRVFLVTYIYTIQAPVVLLLLQKPRQTYA